MRMRKKKNLVPRMERCSDYLVQDGFGLRGRWRETLMPAAAELRVELGCGKGRFTVETARLEPDVLFIAIEKVPDAMVVAMERAAALELKNVFFVVGDAALLDRKALKMGGQIHFKTDNVPLFEFSLEEFPQAGYTLQQVTRNLHGDGPQGVMTDYEAKFYDQGVAINRCVGTMVPWTPPAAAEEEE